MPVAGDYFKTEVLIGDPCGTCGQFAPTGDGDLGYCNRYKTWQQADFRPWKCSEYQPVTEIAGALGAMKRSMIRLNRTMQYFSGENAGSPKDPKYYEPTTNKKELALREKELEMRLRKLTDGL